MGPALCHNGLRYRLLCQHTALIAVPISSTALQRPANAPGKTGENGPDSWASASTWETTRSPWLPASTWHSPGCFSYLGNEPAGKRIFSLSHTLPPTL